MKSSLLWILEARCVKRLYIAVHSRLDKLMCMCTKNNIALYPSQLSQRTRFEVQLLDTLHSYQVLMCVLACPPTGRGLLTAVS